jgi:hypothetical protein
LAQATRLYHKKPSQRTLLQVITTSAHFTTVFPISVALSTVLTVLTVLATAVQPFIEAFNAALAAFHAPNVNNHATSRTKEAHQTTHLSHLSQVLSSHAIPFQLIDVQTS